MAKALILIVEDDGIVARDIQNRLKSLGFEVTASVSSGEEAIIRAKEDLPDLVLMDIVLKGEIDGIEAAEIIRSRFDIPVVFLTAYADEERLERAKLTAPFGYILKPFQDRDLKITIEMALYAAKVDAKRKQAEEALRKSEDKLDAIFSSVHTGIIVIDAESHTIIDANPYAVSRIGVSADKIAGKVCHEFICPSEKGKCPITDLDQTVVSSESILLSIDGERIPILKSVTSLNMDDKKYFLESFIDISDLKKAEEEKKRLEAQLQQSQKLESVGILAGGIAHDFNNLLSIILGNISMAKDDVKPEYGVTEFLNEAEDASLLARDLTKQLITFSKGGAPVKKISYISNLIEKATDFALSGSNVRCEFNMPDDLWATEIDKGQIRHVINNVVINAVQAMPQGGTVEVCAENFIISADKGSEMLSLQDGKYVKISFRDQGVGISDQDLPMIFDPYYSSKARGAQKGMGLGLATSYAIIKKHNGEITPESEVGVGTTINIYLPASAIKGPVKKKLEEKELTGKGKILVMDDEEMIRKMLSQMVSRLGYEAVFSKEGAEAIEIYKKAKESGEPFDAVILDLTVRGGMGGKHAIEKLIEIDPEVKGVVSSGHSDDPVMTDFRAYGFKGVINKPFGKNELSKILNKVIVEGSYIKKLDKVFMSNSDCTSGT